MNLVTTSMLDNLKGVCGSQQSEQRRGDSSFGKPISFLVCQSRSLSEWETTYIDSFEKALIILSLIPRVSKRLAIPILLVSPKEYHQS